LSGGEGGGGGVLGGDGTEKTLEVDAVRPRIRLKKPLPVRAFLLYLCASAATIG